MHQLLEKILRKRKIENINEMTADEKATFDTWRAILTEQEITVEVIKEFLTEQKQILWRSLEDGLQKEVPNNRILFLRARITNYEALLGLIKTPKGKVAKETLEKYLEQLIKQ